MRLWWVMMADCDSMVCHHVHLSSSQFLSVVLAKTKTSHACNSKEETVRNQSVEDTECVISCLWVCSVYVWPVDVLANTYRVGISFCAYWRVWTTYSAVNVNSVCSNKTLIYNMLFTRQNRRDACSILTHEILIDSHIQVLSGWEWNNETGNGISCDSLE